MQTLVRIAVERGVVDAASGRLAPIRFRVLSGATPVGITPAEALGQGHRFPELPGAFQPTADLVERGVLPDGYYLLQG
jgi:hypothetical protein